MIVRWHFTIVRSHFTKMRWHFMIVGSHFTNSEIDENSETDENLLFKIRASYESDAQPAP